MTNTYTALHYHIVFSTKSRMPLITPDIEQRVWSYIGGVARHHNMVALSIGGFDDHIHALIGAPATVAPSVIAQQLKGDSSRWIHTSFPAITTFAWQEGYGAFTVSKSNLDTVDMYIQRQRKHHANVSFKDEYLTMLKLHNIEPDEQFVFG